MPAVTLSDPQPDEEAIRLFMEFLGATYDAALKLAAEGHSSIEEVAYVPMNELQQTGLETSVLNELRAKARKLLLP